MSAARRFASRLLNALARHSPPGCQDWLNAMLRELDFIESDWVAFFWALGGITTIFKYSVPRRVKQIFGKHSADGEKPMANELGKKTVGVISGIAVAAGIILLTFSVVWLMFRLFPQWDLGPVPWWAGVIVVPEITFIAGVVTLWRRRRPMAVGILLMAITLATHFIVHVAGHGSHH